LDRRNTSPIFHHGGGHYAGFVLVTKHCKYITDAAAHSIAEFFVMRKYRKMGIGKQAAQDVFDMFPGLWEVRVLHINVTAIPFWSKVITEYTGGTHTFHPIPIADWEGLGYTFNSRKNTNEGGE